MRICAGIITLRGAGSRIGERRDWLHESLSQCEPFFLRTCPPQMPAGTGRIGCGAVVVLLVLMLRHKPWCLAAAKLTGPGAPVARVVLPSVDGFTPPDKPTRGTPGASVRPRGSDRDECNLPRLDRRGRLPVGKVVYLNVPGANNKTVRDGDHGGGGGQSRDKQGLPGDSPAGVRRMRRDTQRGCDALQPRAVDPNSFRHDSGPPGWASIACPRAWIARGSRVCGFAVQ